MLITKNKLGFSKRVLFFILSFFYLSLNAEESVLLIEWEVNQGAMQYIIEISDSKKFNKILFSKKVNEAVILIEPDQKFKFGRIVGVDKFGSIGKFSEIFPLRPRIITSKIIPIVYKDKKIYKSREVSHSKQIKDSENWKKISEKRIRMKEREKTNNEIFSKIVDTESSLNLFLKNIYLQRAKLNELELEILRLENLTEKDLEKITNEANKILDSLKDVEREATLLLTSIQRETTESQKALTQLNREIKNMDGKFLQKENSRQLEDKFLELKTYSEEEMEKMEDLLREINSLNKKKTNISKLLKNLRKEIIYFQSNAEDKK